MLTITTIRFTFLCLNFSVSDRITFSTRCFALVEDKDTPWVAQGTPVLFVNLYSMKKEKKPDAIVFDEETQSYNGSLLPYATGVGAPKITPPDVTTWKNTNIISANNEFKAKFEDIQMQYEQMMEQFEYNNLVYSAKYSFEPITGKTYHLYRAKDASTFLSILSPQECNFDFLGSFRLGPDKMWEKLPIG